MIGAWETELAQGHQRSPASRRCSAAHIWGIASASSPRRSWKAAAVRSARSRSRCMART